MRPREKQLLVKTHRCEIVHILEVVSSDPAVIVTALDDIATRDRPARMLITLSTPTDGDDVRARLSIRTELDPDERITVPIYASAAPSLRADCPAALFDEAPAGTATATVELALQNGARLKSARVTDAGVVVNSIGRSDEVARVELGTRTEMPLGTFRGWLELEISAGASTRCVRLPYRGRITVGSSEKEPIVSKVKHLNR